MKVEKRRLQPHVGLLPLLRFMPSRFSIVLALIAACTLRFDAAGEISFNAQIRPILSDRCLACHGPDEKNRKAKLRLDSDEDVFKPRDGKFVVKPGAPNES